MDKKWTTHHVTMPLDKAAEYLGKVHVLVNKFDDPGFVIAVSMAERALLNPPTTSNEALTLEKLGEAIKARYDVADMLEDFKKEAEFSDHSVGINGITWAESALLAAIIDRLNVGRPPEEGE